MMLVCCIENTKKWHCHIAGPLEMEAVNKTPLLPFRLSFTPNDVTSSFVSAKQLMKSWDKVEFPQD